MSDKTASGLGLGEQKVQTYWTEAHGPNDDYLRDLLSRQQSLAAEDAATRRRHTRELAMQMAIQANVSGTDASDLVRAAKIIGDFLEGGAA